MVERITLPSQEELQRKFKESFTAAELERHKDFYDALLMFSGKEAGEREIVIWIALALKFRAKGSDSFNISAHIDILAGKGSPVALEARATMERVALRMAPNGAHN